MEKLLCNGLDTIVSQALKEMEEESGQAISLDEVNLAELSRRTPVPSCVHGKTKVVLLLKKTRDTLPVIQF